jgi:type IV pilus assembly protein PilO
MAADNPLTKLPLMGQLGVSVVAAGIIVGSFWYFYWQDAVAKEQTKQGQLNTLREDIRKLEAVAAKLEEFRSKVTQLEGQLETLKRFLPTDKETPDLMRKVQYLASQSNLIVRRFTPSPTVNKDYYQEWPINLEVDGSYHNLGLFLDRVGRLQRLVNVGSVKVRAQTKQTASNTISANCVATTYVYVEKAPEPPKQAAPQPAGAK